MNYNWCRLTSSSFNHYSGSYNVTQYEAVVQDSLSEMLPVIIVFNSNFVLAPDFVNGSAKCCFVFIHSTFSISFRLIDSITAAMLIRNRLFQTYLLDFIISCSGNWYQLEILNMIPDFHRPLHFQTTRLCKQTKVKFCLIFNILKLLDRS